MNFQTDDLQAERLKQILFPRKTRASRTSVNTTFSYLKQNQQSNRAYDIKQQILKLKHGIQTFMDKQPLNDNFLTTPRECLQIIKCMTDKMSNYREQIEEAINTLIESIPKPLVGVTHHSKYYLMHLKFSFLHSVFYGMRRKIIANAYQKIKRQSIEHQTAIRKQEQQMQAKHQSMQKLITSRISKAFNRWRLAAFTMKNSEIQAYFYDKNIAQPNKMMKLLSDESRMVLWLQKLVECNADGVQILLYNWKTGTLRSYKIETQTLTSVFESVHNQSTMSHIDQSIQHLNCKIKRLQINLEHSITKICLVKRQSVSVGQMHRDPDYTKIDDYTCLHGLSAREMSAGCIFTPIVYRNACIGIIRQYFYGRLGQSPSIQTVSMVAQMLQHTIKTNAIFQQIKDRSLAIRNRSYLKAVIISNHLQKNEQFTQQHQQQFYNLLCSYFPIKYLSQFGYQAINTIDKFPRYTVHAYKQSKITVNQIISVLIKMSQCQIQYLHQGNTLHIKTQNRIYSFQMLKNIDNVNQIELEQTGIKLVRDLMIKKEQIKQKKQKEHKQMIAEKQRLQKYQQQKQVIQLKNKILQFCLQDNVVNNGDDLYKVLMQYMSKFVMNSNAHRQGYNIKIVNKLLTKSATQGKNSIEILLYQDQYMAVSVSCVQGQLHIDQIVLQPLKDICAHLVAKMTKPHPILLLSQSELELKAQLFYQMDDPSLGITNLLKHVLNLMPDQPAITISPVTNPFASPHYYLFIETRHIDTTSPQAIIKSIKNYGSLQHSHLHQLSTVICLDSQYVFIVHRQMDIDDQFVTSINQIYCQWKKQRDTAITNIQMFRRNANIVKAVHKMDNVIMCNKIKYIFYRIKNAKIRVRHIPTRLLEAYIHRQNKKLTNYAFCSIKNIIKQKDDKIVCYADLEYGIKKIINSIYRLSNVKLLFTNLSLIKIKQKRLRKMLNVIESNFINVMRVSFNMIYLKKHIPNTNKFWQVEKIFTKVKQNAFESIRRYSFSIEYQQLTSAQTECSMISKMNNVHEIGKLLRQRFPLFQVYLYLKSGEYLGLTEYSVSLSQQLRDKTGNQHFQFGCQSKSLIRNILWLVPEVQNITLIEKHYLQVVSRAIQQGFSKFLCRNQEFLVVLNSFFISKCKKLKLKALKNLRLFTIAKVRAEQYLWRDSYYEASIEVQNYKLMERQQKNEEQQRMIELAENLEAKQKYQQSLNQYRKTIVRLQVSSRHLEQMETKIRLQCQRQQALKMFNFWRLETAYHKKHTVRRNLARKKQQFVWKRIHRLFESKKKNIIQSSFKMILVKSADIRAKNMSAQKQILQKKDQNRLLTFQDELNQFISAQQAQKDKQFSENKQLNIIPVSFKHFQGSKKENYDVTLTDQETKKMNGGAYKLNAKTLKFLKRMGKLQ